MISAQWFKQLLPRIDRMGSIVSFLFSAQIILFSSMPALAETTPSSTPTRKAILLAAKNRSLPSQTGLLSQAMGGSLKVSNGTNRDAYVKLIEPNFQQLVAAFFVKSNSSYTLNPIPDGTYRVLFALGKNWNPGTQSFAQSKSFAKFDKPLSFTTTQLGNGIQYKVFQITLHPVVGGKARTSGVNEQEFKRY
jgi:hypothetical protein